MTHTDGVWCYLKVNETIWFVCVCVCCRFEAKWEHEMRQPQRQMNESQAVYLYSVYEAMSLFRVNEVKTRLR